MSEIIVLPGSGEVVSLDGPLESFVGAWDYMVELAAELAVVKREVSDEIASRLDHEGRRSLQAGTAKFEVTAPTGKEWDLPELQQVLNDLVTEGTISRAKADRCIKWEPSAVWSELKALLSDPRCKARVEHCVSEVAKARYVKVTHA